MKRNVLKLAMLFALGACLAAQAGEKQYSNLSFRVLKLENGKPVRNASVVLHLVDKDGKQEKGGFQLKTDREGKTKFDGVPYGKLRVQVIASGLQTWGEDVEINAPTHEIEIKLDKPKEQYSIYEK